MGSYTAIKGQVLSINLLDDLTDNGWVISGGKAIHSGCNAGTIELRNSNYTVGVPNLFMYKVSGLTSGGVNIRVGSTNGVTRTANGEYTDVLTPETNDKVFFYSDGSLTVEYLRVAPESGLGQSNGTTFGFDEKNNRFPSFYSYEPEFMLKFINGFFTFKEGQLWEHNVNEVRNNFYGVQYSSKIKYYVNVNPTQVKEFFTMRQKSNKPWAVTEAYIDPTDGKPDGQKTRIKKGNFKLLQTDYFAPFLRNQLDPRYSSEFEALMKGGSMQGSYIEINLENEDTVEVRLFSVDVECAPHNYTY